MYCTHTGRAKGTNPNKPLRLLKRILALISYNIHVGTYVRWYETMSRAKRREDVFYQLFREYGEKIVSTAEVYQRIFDEYPTSQALIPSMKEYENICDGVARKLFSELATSFITPFDREDIVQLTKRIDDIADYMEAAASALELLNVGDCREEAKKLAAITVKAVGELHKALDRFSDFKKDKTIMDLCIGVDVVEDEADAIYKNAVADLFHASNDPLETMKWMRIYDRMELAVNACEDACDTISGVILKNA